MHLVVAVGGGDRQRVLDRFGPLISGHGGEPLRCGVDVIDDQTDVVEVRRR